MATKKQQRRRQKERRHEWEEVYVDADGNVVDSASETNGAPTAAAATPRRASSVRRGRTASGRSGRTVQPPSWTRVLKRGLIFAPLMFLTVSFLSPKNTSTAQHISQTLFLLLIFVPFSYAMDTMTYRMWRKRTGQTDTGAKRS